MNKMGPKRTWIREETDAQNKCRAELERFHYAAKHGEELEHLMVQNYDDRDDD